MEFDRDPQIFNQGDLDSWRRGFLFVAEEILYHTELLESPHSFYAFPCEYGSCFQFGPCAYIPLCKQNRSLDDMNIEGYHEEFWDVLKTGHKEDI